MIKQAIIVLAFLLISVAGAGAHDIEWTAGAKTNGDSMIAGAMSKTGNNLLSGQSRPSFENDVSILRLHFPTIQRDDTRRAISYYSGTILKGIARKLDIIDKYKGKALNFAHTAFDNTHGPAETLEVLGVDEDYGAQQKKDAVTGEISPDVDLKTYSYTAIIGRKLAGSPVFNSVAFVEIDPTTDEIVSFRFRNWEPIYSVTNASTQLTWSEIHNKVEARLEAQRAEIGQAILKFRVDRLLSGWIFDGNSGEAIPAFLHSGIVYVSDYSSGKTLEKKYAFIERPDNVSNSAQPSIPESATTPASKPEEMPVPSTKK